MKRFGKIAVGLAGGLALNAGLCAPNPAAMHNPAPNNSSSNNLSPDNSSSDNPYVAIAARNIFGLVPPAPPPDPALQAEKDLPKITPTGIMGVFGDWQVLFKVAPSGKGGPAAKEEFYTLSEGQRQDDIEVVKIDDKKSLVTFDNHGFTQELPLAEAPASGGPSAAASSPVAGNPGMARGGGNNGSGGFTRFGAGPGGPNGGMPNGNPGSNGGGPNAANGGMNFGANTQSHIYQPPPSQMTKEESTILIEAQRAALMNNPNPPYSPALLPTTPLTKFNTPDGN